MVVKTAVCGGSSHDGHRLRLPLTEEYWYFSKGKHKHPCKMCRMVSGRVPTKKIKPLAEELVDRIGFNQAVERTGLPPSTLYRLTNGKYRETNKKTAHLIILTLYQVRKEMRSEKIAWARKETIRRLEREQQMLGY